MQRALRAIALPPDVPQGVEVWHLDTRRPDLLHAALKLLSENELARHHRYMDRATALRFALTRATLRMLIADRTGRKAAELSFDYGHHGKPQLADPESSLHFSVSYSGQHTLLALSDKYQIGVDIENSQSPRVLASLAQKLLSSREKSCCPDFCSEHFPRLWTGKESVIKAWGWGSDDPISVLSVLPGKGLRYVIRYDDTPVTQTRAWTLNVISGHAAALALSRQPLGSQPATVVLSRA
ncbi:4'-phosphopantetheinyl transferase family protein [Viridibacterium curvum]|uniref:4'-phosphopantetheinyl transferase superfamily protein n=1 Tax=Viridibacterium curvum TaxID=1101404 RepID=A0ABP9QFA3_9RHOO